MTFRDRLRLIFAKISRKETILFSMKEQWVLQKIQRELQGRAVFFYEFDEVDPNIFDIAVPLTLPAQKYANAHPGLFTSKNAIIPSNYCINLCDDKERFHRFLVTNGFGMFAPKIHDGSTYPYVLKKKIGKWGVDTVIISNSQDEQANIEKTRSNDYFKQECITGRKEYAGHVVIMGGKIVFLKTIEFTFRDEQFVKSAHCKPSKVKEVDHSHLKTTFEDILVKMGYQGMCCFDYKIGSRGPMIFEVNPRYGASMINFLDEAVASYKGALSHEASQQQ